MKNTGTIISVIAGVSIIVFAAIFGAAYKYKYKVSNTINVTGNAKQNFESDIVKWSASFNRKSMNLSDASEELKRDRDLVREFLIAQHVKVEEIVFDAVNINREFSYHTDGSGIDTIRSPVIVSRKRFQLNPRTWIRLRTSLEKYPN